MAQSKELSEQELVALNALDSAVRFASITPVAICFIRRFTKTRETKKDGILQCTARITFGFRPLTSDEHGTATAVVLLKRVLTLDSEKLCHHYFVWAPASVDITVNEGQRLIYARSDQLRSVIGNIELAWLVYVKYAPSTLTT